MEAAKVWIREAMREPVSEPVSVASPEEAGGGGAPAAGETLALVTVAEDVSNDSDSVYATDMSFVLAANTEYVIECVLHLEAASGNQGVTFKLDSVPAGATGRWSVLGGVGTVNKTASGDLTDTLALASLIQTANNALVFRIRVTTGETGDTMNFQHIAGTNGTAIVVKADSAALVRAGATVTSNESEIVANSDTTYEDVVSLDIAAGKKTWVEIDVPFASAATTTGAAWSLELTGTGATMLSGMIGNRTDGSTDLAIRTDNTVFVSAGSKTSGNLVRFKILVTTTTNAATLVLKGRSEVDSSAITIPAGGAWARQKDVTDTVQVLAEDNLVESITPETDFSHTVEADTNYWISSMASFTTFSTAIGIRTDIDGIPSGATAKIATFQNDASSMRAFSVIKTTGADHTSAFGDDDPPFPWWDEGLLQVGDTPGTFTQRHGGETSSGATVKAGSFALAEAIG